jgi:hypothetical protein
MRVFGIGFGRGRGPRTLTPEQRMNMETVEQDKVDHVVGKQDARYDAMTDQERERYYMKPNLMTKIKKALRGGQ